MFDLRNEAAAYGRKIALPEIRSMYPSISRGEMAHLLAAAFLAGADLQREREDEMCTQYEAELNLATIDAMRSSDERQSALPLKKCPACLDWRQWAKQTFCSACMTRLEFVESSKENSK